MNWTELLKAAVEQAYPVTDALMAKVRDDELNWKPATGENWMTLGQLLMHLTTSCGTGCRGFVTGDWGMPPGMKLEDLSPEDMLPPAEKLPTIESVAEARRKLAEDKALALQMIDQAGEADLDGRISAAPWDPPGMQKSLGQHLLSMVMHLDSHKAQLFYYLKLMGRPVNTHDLWG
jgi:uncharacterized damage-inducible protein DinB